MAKRKFYQPGRKGGRVVLRGRQPLEIGPRGYSTEDLTEQSVLDNHPLKGHANGFVEVEAPVRRRKKERAKKLGQIDNSKDSKTESKKGSSKKDSKKDSDKGSATEDIKTVNQAKDYLIKAGVEAKNLTSKKKILDEAKKLNPPVEFPNL